GFHADEQVVARVEPDDKRDGARDGLNPNAKRHNDGPLRRSAMLTRRLVLVTGAAGMIGKQLQGYLRERYRLRLLYHRSVLPAVGDDDVMTGDVCDLATVEKAVEGVSAIVHLAGEPNQHATF